MTGLQSAVNERLRGQRCIGCGEYYPAERDLLGCPACRDRAPANLELAYDLSPDDRGWVGRWERRRGGLWRFEELLPVPATAAVSLGEGGTPLLECSRAGAELGLPRLLYKDESQNPTWSFKDRLASVAVSWAATHGRPGVVVSSSGNAGASAAAYAARAGLPCIAFTAPAFSGTLQRVMRSYGALVVATPTPADRWELNRAVAREWGFLPVSNTTDPPVGSHPTAVEGCKTIACEIAEDLGWRPPDAVIVPTAFGDCLAGLHLGFEQLRAIGVVETVPRLFAAETGGSLERALEKERPMPVQTEMPDSRALSVGITRSTAQALRAIRATGGAAVAVGDDEILARRDSLRTREGLFAERSAALGLAAAARLRESGLLGEEDVVVTVGTSSGMKDLDMDEMGAVPVVEPELGELETVLSAEYGYRA
jgi:threonine synthase